VIRMVDGNTCAPQYSIAGAGLIIGSVTPAVGDIDGDGRPDIVTQHQGGGVMGFKFDPAQNKFVELWTNYSSFNAAGCHWDSVAIHDLDDDGVPEIVTNGPFPAVYDNHGALLDGSAVSTTYSALLHPVLGDLDGDGSIELIDGKEAFRFDKATKKWVPAAGISVRSPIASSGALTKSCSIVKRVPSSSGDERPSASSASPSASTMWISGSGDAAVTASAHLCIVLLAIASASAPAAARRRAEPAIAAPASCQRPSAWAWVTGAKSSESISKLAECAPPSRAATARLIVS